jgi:hypothetical protein
MNGEDVDRGAPRREYAEDGNEQGENDKSVRPPQGDLYDPHVSRLPGATRPRRRNPRPIEGPDQVREIRVMSATSGPGTCAPAPRP